MVRASYDLEAFECDDDDLRVRYRQDLREGRYTALLHEELDLVRAPSRSGVADGPCGLLANVQLGITQEVDEGRDEVRVQDSLDLVLVARSDFRNGPACFLCRIRKLRERMSE